MSASSPQQHSEAGVMVGGLPYTASSAIRNHSPPGRWVLFVKGLSTPEGIITTCLHVCVTGSQQNYTSTQVDHRTENKNTIIHLQSWGQTQNLNPEDTLRPYFKGLLVEGEIIPEPNLFMIFRNVFNAVWWGRDV